MQQLGSSKAISGKNIAGAAVSYTEGLSVGGASSATRYTKLVVPTGKTANVYVAFVTGSNGNKRGCGIGTESSSSKFDTVALVQNSSTSEMSYLTTETPLAAGTYYINTDSNIRIYAIQVQLLK